MICSKLPRVLLPCILLSGMMPPSGAQTPAAGSTTTPNEPQSRPQAPSPATSLPPALTLDFNHMIGTPNNAVLEGGPGQPARLTYGGELTVEANKVEGDLTHQRYDAVGSVRIHEMDTTLLADSFLYDGSGHQNKGVATNAQLTHRPYTLRAKQIDVNGNTIIAQDADFTTARPGTKPDFNIRAQHITFFPTRRRGEIRHGSIYLFGKRVLAISSIGFRYGRREGGSQNEPVLPEIGFRGSGGPYIAKNGVTTGAVPIHYHVLIPTRQSVEALVSADQPLFHEPDLSQDITVDERAGHKDYLGAIRKFATAARPPLPYGDPLLFHDFITETNPVILFPSPPRRSLGLEELLGVHQQATGRLRSDLFVSSIPEVSLSGILPLFSQTNLPANAPPGAVRRELRSLAFTLHGAATVGEYKEQPTNIQRSRGRYVLGLDGRPYLIARNTVVAPSVSWTSNSYSGSKSSYRYTQYSLTANHYFTDRSAVGVTYLVSNTVGDSPFDFDVLDTTRELDGRLQLGNHRLAVSFLSRFDLVRHDLIGLKVAVAPTLNGFIPVIGYDSRSRGFNFGVAVEGITF